MEKTHGTSVYVDKPQDQEEHDQPEIEKTNALGDSLDPHLRSAFDLTACCSSDGRHCTYMRVFIPLNSALVK